MSGVPYNNTEHAPPQGIDIAVLRLNYRFGNPAARY